MPNYSCPTCVTLLCVSAATTDHFTISAISQCTASVDLLPFLLVPMLLPCGLACVCRYDESDDSVFYDAPRFVYHIDDGAVKAITE